LDLGQPSEFTALCVVERNCYPSLGKCEYACRHVTRFPMGTAYPRIIEGVQKLLTTPSRTGQWLLYGATMMVDGTAVGKPVTDLFKQDMLPVRAVPFAITAGLSATYESGFWHVPKKELSSVLQVLLQTRRLRIAGTLPAVKVLARELETFRPKTTAVGNDTVEDWREREHDDLVLALAAALWYAELHAPKRSAAADYGIEFFGHRRGMWG
jgi:hypothetical protein